MENIMLPSGRSVRPERLQGLFYLLLITLAAAMVGGLFKRDSLVLLLPSGLISLLLLSGVVSKSPLVPVPAKAIGTTSKFN